MAGIAAEATQNGRAEGGQEDERALVQCARATRARAHPSRSDRQVAAPPLSRDAWRSGPRALAHNGVRGAQLRVWCLRWAVACGSRVDRPSPAVPAARTARRLLGSLDGGASWDLVRVQNQARWAASQGVLLLREYGGAYRALCEALERGEGVGGCVTAIEGGIDDAYGRNGELPAQRRARQLASKAEAAAESGAAAAAAARGGASAALEDLGERQAQIAARLEAIQEELEREDATWT
eukprot:5653284-Prymnesium_polylepis.2